MYQFDRPDFSNSGIKSSPQSKHKSNLEAQMSGSDQKGLAQLQAAQFLHKNVQLKSDRLQSAQASVFYIESVERKEMILKKVSIINLFS